MRSKEEYYDLVLENRRLAADPQIVKCTCPNTLCDWHGKCKECVALHRHHNDHIPVCLQSIIGDKLKALAGVVEMVAIKKMALLLSIGIMSGKEINSKVSRVITSDITTIHKSIRAIIRRL